MAGSRTDVANLALARAGAGAVTSLDDDTGLEARVLRAEWDLLRDAVLREHPWDFATAWARPARLADPSPAARHAFAMPPDCLYVREAREGGKPLRTRGPFRVPPMGAAWAVHLDAEEPEVMYTRRVEDVAKWPAEFIDLLAWKMAAHLCMAVRGLSDGLQACQAMHDKVLSDARRLDAREDGTEPCDTPSRFERARW